MDDCLLKEISPKFIASVASSEEARRRLSQPLTPEKEAYIRKADYLEHVPERLQKAYLNLILKHHMAVSQNKKDLRRTETLLHHIELPDQKPASVKQLKIPDAHRQEVEQNITEWLMLRVVQPCRSEFNSPLFCVMKKNGSLRLVKDFRALNTKSLDDKYSIKDFLECIDEIGQSGSTLSPPSPSLRDSGK